MSTQPDKGESSTSINRWRDDSAWSKVKPLLEAGCTLRRPHMLQTFYPHNGVEYVGGTGGLTSSRVKRLEREGVLTYVGPDRYALTSDAEPTMTERQDGGPAFPAQPVQHLINGASITANTGMSLRDWFAGQALSALHGWVPPVDKNEEAKHGADAAMNMARARHAYHVADAMLAERAKTGGGDD